jgi:hypothetical protein
MDETSKGKKSSANKDLHLPGSNLLDRATTAYAAELRPI